MTTKIISHNKKNKKNIAQAIAFIFDEQNKIPEYLRKIILVRLIWAATEQDDEELFRKYLGQPYWSIGAINQFLKNLKEKSAKKNINLFADLRHEHAVPKKEIRNRIMQSDKTEKSVFEILNNLAHAVIVSKVENEELNKEGLRMKMPNVLNDSSDIKNVFSRYIATGIKVCNIGKKDLKKLALDDIDELKLKSLT